MNIQYRVVVYPRAANMGPLKWIELQNAGWDVEYKEPRQYYNQAGVRATKKFDSLVQAVVEWEMLTGCNVQDSGATYEGMISRRAASSLPRRVPSSRKRTFYHSFVINPGEDNEEVLIGKSLKKALRVRINV